MNDKQVPTKQREQQWRTPLCDIFEDTDGYHIAMDMPGVEDKNLEITFQNGSLTVAGKVSGSEAAAGFRPARREYAPYDFRREFTIAERNVAVDKITAELRNGELLLRLPKSETVKPRKIEVKTA